MATQSRCGTEPIEGARARGARREGRGHARRRRCRRGLRPHDAARRCGGRRADGGGAAAARTRRRGPRPFHDVAARRSRPGRGDGAVGRALSPRAGVHVAPDGGDGIGIMLVSGPQAVFDAVRGALEKMTGEVWYLGEQPIWPPPQDFRQLDAVRDHRRPGRCVRDGARARHRPDSRRSGVLEVPGRRPDQVRGEKMARGDFCASFELTMARKDIRLMIEAAGAQPMVVLPSIAKGWTTRLRRDTASRTSARSPRRSSRRRNRGRAWAGGAGGAGQVARRRQPSAPI